MLRWLWSKVFTEKMEGFGSKFKRRGNIAGMYIDGDVDTMYYAHSLLSENDNGYKGDGNLIKKAMSQQTVDK